MLASFRPTRRDLRDLLVLAAPMVATQVGLMLLGTIDTITVGHFSNVELAGATLGNLYVAGLMMFGMGTLWALDPIIAQAFGAREDESIARGLQRGLLLATGLGVVLGLLCIPAVPVFHALHQPAEAIPSAARFAWISAPSLLPIFWFIVLRQSLQSMRITTPTLLAVLAANVLNLGLDLVLVFGHLGAPAMGAAGAAIASAVARLVMVVLLVVLAWPALAPYLARLRREALEPGPLFGILRLGLPIGVTYFAEVSAFGLISLLVARFGAALIRGFRGLTVKEEELRSNKVPVQAIVGSVDPLRDGVVLPGAAILAGDT